MINIVKDRMTAGENVPNCLVKSLLEYEEEEQLSWTDMCLLTTAFATGGSHSVSEICSSYPITANKMVFRHRAQSNGS